MPDPFYNQPTFTNLSTLLEDIAGHVQIQPNLTIEHPQRGSSALSTEIFNALQQLPIPDQDHYLRWRLGRFLYNTYDGNPDPTQVEADERSERGSMSDHPVQNRAEGKHSPFYINLNENNQGQGYFDPGWQVIDQLPNDNLIVVYKNNLKLHVSPERHLAPAQKDAMTGEVVSIRLPRNRLESKCYVAISNAGPPENDEAEGTSLANIYFNIGAEGAIALMGDLTTALNPLQVPFTFKVPYDADEYAGTSSGTLMFKNTHYEAIRPLLTEIYHNRRSHFRPEVPLMTKP
ncbi:MAG: T3SS effector HopA1 family protein, partial [Thermosynechococcaceae cyanobacterium]